MNWAPGQILQPLRKSPITREQLREYANASGDMNLIHLEDEFAKQAGFPSVIVHGMLSMAYLSDHLLLNFPEGIYKLNRLKSRFRKVTFPGDTLCCEGKIKTVSSEGKISVSLWIKNQNEETTVDGEADLEWVNRN